MYNPLDINHWPRLRLGVDSTTPRFLGCQNYCWCLTQQVPKPHSHSPLGWERVSKELKVTELMDTGKDNLISNKKQKPRWCTIAYHQLMPSQFPSNTTANSSSHYSRWHHTVWNIHSTSFCQLSWFCPSQLPAPILALPSLEILKAQLDVSLSNWSV